VRHSVDLTDAPQVAAVFRQVQPDFIVLLASVAVVQNSFAQANAILDNNIHLHMNVLEAIRLHASQARCLSVGSGDCYGYQPELATSKTPFPESAALHPNSPYAISKATQEMLSLSYARAHNLQLVAVRAFNHTGERQAPLFAIPSFAQQIVAIERGTQDVLQVGNLQATRDMSDVKDIVAGYWTCLTRGKPGEVYNLASGRGYTMQEMLQQLLQFAHTTIRVQQDPARQRPSDTPWLVADTTNVRTLGWHTTVTLESTLQRVLEYWRHV
jgi:GDP-4-dehydro-6-deoxy-D-mannose reductase